MGVADQVGIRFFFEIVLLGKSRMEIALSVSGTDSDQRKTSAEALRLARVLITRVQA